MSRLKGLVCWLECDVLFRESHVTFFMGAIMGGGWGEFNSCLVLSRSGGRRGNVRRWMANIKWWRRTAVGKYEHLKSNGALFFCVLLLLLLPLLRFPTSFFLVLHNGGDISKRNWAFFGYDRNVSSPQYHRLSRYPRRIPLILSPIKRNDANVRILKSK